MEDHRVAAVRVDQAVLGAPTQVGDRRSGQALPEIRRKGSPEVGPPCFDARDSAAFQDSLKTTNRGFDFGKLWHRCDMAEGGQPR